MDTGLKLAVEAAGSRAALARMLGIRRQAVWGWFHVPVGRVLEIEKQLGIPRSQLRPDIWRKS